MNFDCVPFSPRLNISLLDLLRRLPSGNKMTREQFAASLANTTAQEWADLASNVSELTDDQLETVVAGKNTAPGGSAPGSRGSVRAYSALSVSSL
jgi:hypothetical protein